jgi:hypothetical protein
MTPDNSCPECGAPISDGVLGCPKCTDQTERSTTSPNTEAVQPPTKMSRTEIVLSVLLSAVFIGFCIYALRENPLLGIALAVVASIIGAIGWFVTGTFRWLRNLARRKKA